MRVRRDEKRAAYDKLLQVVLQRCASEQQLPPSTKPNECLVLQRIAILEHVPLIEHRAVPLNLPEELLVHIIAARKVVRRDQDLPAVLLAVASHRVEEFRAEARALFLLAVVSLDDDVWCELVEFADPVFKRGGGDTNKMRALVAGLVEVREEADDLDGLTKT